LTLTNAVAYIIAVFITDVKCFIVQATGSSVIKLFKFVINSLLLFTRMFVIVSHFPPSLIFASKAGAYPPGLHFKCRLIDLTANIRLELKEADSDKCSQ
jgi:hypothetical protein